MCVCVCIQIRLFQLEGGKEGSLCHRPHSPSHSEFSHSREVGWRLVQTQNIYCPRIFIVPLVSKETCPFFSLFGDGWRMEFFSPPFACRWYPERECMVQRERQVTNRWWLGQCLVVLPCSSLSKCCHFSPQCIWRAACHVTVQRYLICLPFPQVDTTHMKLGHLSWKSFSDMVLLHALNVAWAVILVVTASLLLGIWWGGGGVRVLAVATTDNS